VEVNAVAARFPHKLAEAFLHDPAFATGAVDLKFIVRNATDATGRRIFFNVNRAFDRHKRASAQRDSVPFRPGEEDAPKIPFKTLFDRRSLIDQGRDPDVRGFPATLITLNGRFVGTLTIADGCLRFTGFRRFDGLGNRVTEVARKIVSLRIADIRFIFNRHQLYIDNSCEVFTRGRKAFLFMLESSEQRAAFYAEIPAQEYRKPENWSVFPMLRYVCGSLAQTLTAPELFKRARVARAWKTRQMSNFEYLYWLNVFSGRSFNDVSQYPVFPWVLKVYMSASLDFSDESIYRDFATPIGAVNEGRLREARALMDEVTDPADRCLFRLHYSNPGTVIGYLIRVEPFTTLHISFQSGCFDQASRLFGSIPALWSSVSGKLNDFRELIPEFFCQSDLLLNANGFDLGKLPNGVSLDDVALPPWASNAFEFVDKHRQALESEYVRSHLPSWIDLIFGCFQRSLEKNNLYHPFSYIDCLDEGLTDDQLTLAQHFCALWDLPDQTPVHPSQKLRTAATNIN
jgi:hypothetical protein